jgi:hypothetical protein
LRTIEAAAPSFGLRLVPAGGHDAAELTQRIAAFAREPNVPLSYFQAPLQFNIAGRLLVQQQCIVCPHCIHIDSLRPMEV